MIETSAVKLKRVRDAITHEIRILRPDLLVSFVASVQCNCAIFYRFWKQHLKGWSAIRSQRVRAKLAHLKHKQTKREIWRNAIDGCCWRECVSHILTIVCADGGCWCNNGIVCCPLYWGEGVLSRYPVVPFSGLSSSFQVGVIIRRLRLPRRSGRHWCGAGSRSETLETSWKTRPLLLLLRDTRFPKRRQQQHWVFWQYLWTSWEVVLGWSGRGGLGWSPHRSRSVELSLKNFPHISLFCNTVHLSRFLPGSSSPLPENIWRMSLNIGQGAGWSGVLRLDSVHMDSSS